jgi:hypothetical protein
MTVVIKFEQIVGSANLRYRVSVPTKAGLFLGEITEIDEGSWQGETRDASGTHTLGGWSSRLEAARYLSERAGIMREPSERIFA